MKTLRQIILFFLVIPLSAVSQKDKYQRYQEILLLKHDSVKCERLIIFGQDVSDSLQDFNFSLMVFENVNSILNQNNYPTLQMKLYYVWGLTLYDKGNYEEADKKFVKALSFKFLDQKPELKAKVLNAAAANLTNIMVYKRALIYHNEALEIYGKLNDEGGKGTVYLNMANIFAMTGNLAQSDEFFDKSIKIFLENKMPEHYATVLGNKAYIKWKLGQLDSGKILLLRSLSVPHDKPKPFKGNVDRHFNVGIIYAELKQWDSCFYYLDRGKQISDSLNLTETQAGSYYYNLGYCYQLKGDLQKGISSYKKALAIKTGIANYRFLIDNISSLHFKLKQYDSAFLYKNLSLKIADSVYKSELQEHINFENKRIELIEKDYEIRVKAAEQEQQLDNLSKRNYLLISVIIILIISVLLLILYFRQYKLREKKEHLESELIFLRAQLNPHFLFNSINNIYVLLDENKEKASEILLKFSDLLRYQLYECNVSHIALSKELHFLSNFIEFEKLRYSNKIEVRYEFESSPSSDLLIAPLLLQPFIENAFKHTPKFKGAQSFIEIRTKIKGQNFILTVSNSLAQKETSTLPGGIGLDNVKKRLKLLYPNKHELKITTTETLYITTLTLTLGND